MDLIYTDANGTDLGVLSAYSLDLSFGATENDFTVTLDKNAVRLEAKAAVYIENTEYGGIVDGLTTNTASDEITYLGRTWHGMLNSKVIQPDSGENYLIVSGDANTILYAMVSRLGLSGLFVAAETASGVNISRYQFPRYCKGYDGIRAMLAKNGAKLKFEWDAEARAVRLSAVPLVDYSAEPVDSDEAKLNIERHETKVNHLICLGRGELADREVIHLYCDQAGQIGRTQFYTGLDEIVEIYENTAVESVEDLESGGLSRFTELRNSDKAEIDLQEGVGRAYDIGDIVGAKDVLTGIGVSAAVTQKIVRIKNGVISTEYKTGG